MPSQILHCLFGEDVITRVHHRVANRFGRVARKALDKITTTYRAPFALGCQGPDIFYHSQRRRPCAVEYGTLLHRRGAGLFTAGLLRMGLPDPPPDEDDLRAGRREKGISALGVYALGFMTHAVLDRRAHPYIVSKSTRATHAFLERVLDTLMLPRLRGVDAAAFDQAALLAAPCAAPPLGLKELLARALVLAYPERAANDPRLPQRIENTFRDCAEFYRLTNPAAEPAGGDAAVIPAALRYPRVLPDLDYLNLAGAPWPRPEPGGGMDTSTFPGIYAAAVESAADAFTPVITRYLDTGVFPIREAAQAIGNGCLSIRGPDGKPCAPAAADPLPLDRVIAALAAG